MTSVPLSLSLNSLSHLSFIRYDMRERALTANLIDRVPSSRETALEMNWSHEHKVWCLMTGMLVVLLCNSGCSLIVEIRAT